MNKPSRPIYRAHLELRWPGATMVYADRGLSVTVRTATLAMEIERDARDNGLDTWIECRGPADYLVRIFGFPRGRQ